MSKGDISTKPKSEKRSKNLRDKTKTQTKITRETSQIVYNAGEKHSTDSGILAATKHRLIIGDATTMPEISSESVHLMVTSPPYFNAPFDYKGLFKNYELYLGMLKKVALETYRVIQIGRIAVLNIDDTLVDGQKYTLIRNKSYAK